MTRHAAKSIFRAFRRREALANLIPRPSSWITAAAMWAESLGSPEWVIRPLVAAE